MSLAPEEEPPVLATAAPSPNEKRDLLGNSCFYLHLGVMFFVVGGWAIPLRAVLGVYLVFLPLMAATWLVNRNTCLLNNIESYLRFGTWRSEHNAEEGAWLKTLIQNVTGLTLKTWQVDLITYGVMAALWVAGYSHRYWW